MSLLELEHVSKHHGPGGRSRAVLSDISLALDDGELVAIWGMRRSGRSTLLRIASGIDWPDSGVVRFNGQDLTPRTADQLRAGIGYCQTTRHPTESQRVLDQLLTEQLSRGIVRSEAIGRAREALERVGESECSRLKPGELDGAEAVRVAIARALTGQPRLLVIDEPTLGVDLLAREAVLELLRSLADDGLAILMSTGESGGLVGADRALSLDGELRGSLEPELAPVVALRHSA